MSSTALNWAKSISVGSANRKAVLLILADYCDEEWSCFPSQKRIAEEAEVGERTVRRILAEWEQEGVIRRERRPSKDGSGRSSDRIFIQPAALAARNEGVLALQAATGAVQPANGDSSTGQGLAREPLENHQKEPLMLVAPERPLVEGASRNEIDAEFDDWWDNAWVQSRKVSKSEARVEYRRARRDTDASTLFEGARAYGRLMRAQGTEPRHIVHPNRWLKKRRWEDEVPAERNPFQGPEMRFG